MSPTRALSPPLAPALLQRRSAWLGAVALSALLCAACVESEAGGLAPLKINGSTTVNPPVAEVAEWLRDERDMDVRIDTQGGSSGGIAMLGEGRVQVGMSSKPVSATDRERYPDVDFVEHRIGVDAVALVVSRDVFEGGVRALDREQLRAIYERRITRWSEVGGPDRRIAFFDKEPGRGTFEVFARWLYGSVENTPSVSHPKVGSNEETRTKVRDTLGAMSQLSSSWVDGTTLFALALPTDDSPSSPISPAPEAILSGTYPLARPLFLVTDGPPRGAARALIELVLSPRGQRVVRAHGYIGLDELGAE